MEEPCRQPAITISTGYRSKDVLAIVRTDNGPDIDLAVV